MPYLFVKKAGRKLSILANKNFKLFEFLVTKYIKEVVYTL